MATDSQKKEEETSKKIADAYDRAKGYFDVDDHIKALKKTEKTISLHGKNELCASHHDLQGEIFFKLANETDIKDIKCIYLLASVESFSSSIRLRPNALSSFCGYARSQIQLGDQLKINNFYKKAESKATLGLKSSSNLPDSKDLEAQLQELEKIAIGKQKNSIAAVAVSGTSNVVTQIDTGEEGDDKKRKRDLAEDLKSFWAGLDDKSKREFLVVDLIQFSEHVKRNYNKEVQNHLEICVRAQNDQWRCWRCHICSEMSYCFKDCKIHIFEKHVHKFKTGSKHIPKSVDEDLANMISSGDWKPVDAVEAAKLINSRAEHGGGEFVYVNGWCSDWPVANDEERENVLKQFAQVIKSSSATLSCTLWEWLIGYTEEHLNLPQVPGIYLDKCGFFKSPQCICFLDIKDLEHILEYVRELTTDVPTSLVSTVANRFWETSLVKERIDRTKDPFSLLLDERLLYEEEHHFDEMEAEIRHCKSSAIYENVKPNGDKIVSWVLDCPETDVKFVSQIAEGVHNLELWFAVLRITRWKKKTLVDYRDMRHRMLMYDRLLGEAEAICLKEDERMNPKQRSSYAFSLRVKCQEHLKKQDDDTKCFLRVVRDVLEKKGPPGFKAIEEGENTELISKLSTTVENNAVKDSLLRLRNSLKEKIRWIDSKVLLRDLMVTKLCALAKLSTIDYRLVILPVVKKFLQEKLEMMMENSEEPERKNQRY